MGFFLIGFFIVNNICLIHSFIKKSAEVLPCHICEVRFLGYPSGEHLRDVPFLIPVRAHTFQVLFIDCFHIQMTTLSFITSADLQLLVQTFQDLHASHIPS